MLHFFCFTILLFISLLSQASPDNPQTPEELEKALATHGVIFSLISQPPRSTINAANRYLLAHGLALTAPQVGNYQFYGVLTLGAPPGGSTQHNTGIPLYIDTASTTSPKQVYIFRNTRGSAGRERHYIVEPAEIFLQNVLKPSQKLIIETAGENATRKWGSARGKAIKWQPVTATTLDEARDDYARRVIFGGYEDAFEAIKNSPDISLFNYATGQPFAEAQVLGSHKISLQKSIVTISITNENLSDDLSLRSSAVLQNTRAEILAMLSGESGAQSIFHVKYLEALQNFGVALPDFGGIALLCPNS